MMKPYISYGKEIIMRKYFKLLTVIVLLAAFVLGVAACVERDSNNKIKLSKPTDLSVFGDTLSWGEVKNAVEYYVAVDGTEVSAPIKGLSYTLNLPQGTHRLKVRAQGDGEKYGTSDYSDEIEFVQKVSLARPVVTLEGRVAKWAAVDHAAHYSVRVTKIVSDKETEAETLITEQTSFTFEGEKYAQNGVYAIRVAANPAEGSEYTQSPVSAEVRYINGERLATPAFSSMSSGMLRWSAVENAQGYTVRYNLRGTEEYEYYTPSGKATSLSLSVLSLASGEYEFAIMARGNGVNYFDSAYSDVSEDYTVRKLPSIEESRVGIVSERTEVPVAFDKKTLKLDLTGIDLTGVKSVVVTLTANKPDGTHTMTPVSKKTDLEENASEASIDLDALFYTIKDGVFTPEFSKDSEKGYYGRNYTITVQLSADTADKKTIASDVTECEALSYRSYKIPTQDGEWFLVSDIGELAFIQMADSSAKFKLTDNIDCAGYDFDTIKTFRGEIDGQGHHIDNLVLGSVTYDGAIYAGFVGVLEASGKIYNLHFINPKTNVVGGADYVGTVAAYNKGDITDCFVSGGQLKADEYADEESGMPFVHVGGISGVNEGYIGYCQTNMTLYGRIVGGIAGISKSGVGFSSSISAVNAVRPEQTEKTDLVLRAGGLIGLLSNNGAGINVTECFARGNVTMQSREGDDALAGGLIGEIGANAYVRNSYSGTEYSGYSSTGRMTVNAQGAAYVGGFVGKNAGTIENCYTTARASSGKVAGGFAGINSGKIDKAYSTSGTIKNGVTGGFVGENSGAISNAYFISDRTGESDTAAQEATGIADLAAKIGALENSSFAMMTGVKNPVIARMYYPSEYTATVTTLENIKTTVKYVDSNGVTQTVNGANEDFVLCSKDGNTAVVGTYIGYFRSLNNGAFNRVYLVVTVK